MIAVRKVARAAAGIVLAPVIITGCAGSEGAASGAIAIKAGDRTCEVANSTLPAGRHEFQVSNTASQITEVYVFAAGDRTVGEVENIGPGTKRKLVLDLAAGSYEVACKPGMAGNGIRTALRVTETRAAR